MDFIKDGTHHRRTSLHETFYNNNNTIFWTYANVKSVSNRKL